METVELESVYRTADEEHLLFQNRIRVSQPSRDTLNQYFSGRILDGSLQDPAVVVNEPATLHPTIFLETIGLPLRAEALGGPTLPPPVPLNEYGAEPSVGPPFPNVQLFRH